MSRAQQDTVIDDDEETCPLCIEEFDLSDKNFRPCPCGYQICQFCFNSLKTTYEASTCPNCRRVYDEKTIQYKIPTAEEFKLDQQNKNRKQAAAKRKETEKREVETSNRRNLAGVRVKQQNLVYVIGLVPTIRDEGALLQTLRGQDYFGQYGEIEKIVVSKAKPGAINQGIGVYVTYTTKDAAADCIRAVDGSMNGDRILRAQFGTTKYCSAYLRGETCNNKNCSFLHETGEDGQNTTLQNEPQPAKNVQKPSYQRDSHTPAPSRQAGSSSQPTSTSSQPMIRQSSRDEQGSRKGSTDASALPSSVNWATANAQITKTRRTSQAASMSSPSPRVANATITPQKLDDVKTKEADKAETASTVVPPENQPTPPVTTTVNPAESEASSSRKPSPAPPKMKSAIFDQIFDSVNSPDFRFIFDESVFSPEELAAIENCPIMIDPLGGVKRRVMREREAAERASLETEAQANSSNLAQTPVLPASEEAVEEEPVESGSSALGGEPEDNPRSILTRGAIQRPSQQSSVSNLINDQFSSLNLNGRSLTPQQRQQLALLSSSSMQQAPNLGQQTSQAFGTGGFDVDQRPNLFQTQSHFEPSHAHARQSSRFNFGNDSAKPNLTRYTSQPQSSVGQQHFYSSGAQGPPPGLKTAGTPPISGGGMFAQGHGFTTNMNSGFGSLKDANTDMSMRARSGTNPSHDVSKRGGVVDLADPSILQARIHQGSAGAAQGLFGGQNQGGYNQSNMAYGGGYNRW